MSKDVFVDWKDRRFIRVDFELLDRPDIMVVLTDVSFWSSNYEELKDWCDEYDCEIQGMTVKFNSEKSLIMFCLKWS
jgi:hypothetical protein